jgi:hypothetical protein
MMRGVPPADPTWALGALQSVADTLNANQVVPSALRGLDLADVQHAVRGWCVATSLLPQERSLGGLRQALDALLPEAAATVLPPLLDQLNLNASAVPAAPRSGDPGYEALLGLELACLRRPGARRVCWEVTRGVERRRGGAHFTPHALAKEVVAKGLRPLLANTTTSHELLEIKVCDPACGAGALLLEVAHLMSDELERRWAQEGRRVQPGEAWGTIAQHCVCGVDRDAVALLLCRLAVSGTNVDVRPELRLGDALSGELAPIAGVSAGQPRDAPSPALSSSAGSPSGAPQVHWAEAFPRAFERERPGFDAVVGNPPWVAYVGRAAQPLATATAEFYRRHYRSFQRYRTLHGLFIERSASLLRENGRLALIVPTSVADLAGYSPTRQAHDQLCQIDDELLDFGDGAFTEVFQPCMALTSTRQVACPEMTPPARTPVWRLPRRDLDRTGEGLLQRLESQPRIPSELFGERGYQTTRHDRSLLTALLPGQALAAEHTPLLTGSEVLEFQRLAPRWSVHVPSLSARLRPADQWRSVALLIRQTARFPIAALSDGGPFRNSILAGFENERFSRYLLLCYLNSAPIRWFHFHRHRDARQGMPQLKIGHLRALPAPPACRSLLGAQLDALGKKLGEQNRGRTSAQQQYIDQLVADFLSLTPAERGLVQRWGGENPAPTPRART